MVALLKYWKLIAVALLLAATFLAGVKWESNSRDAALLDQQESDRERIILDARQSAQIGKRLEAERKTQRDRENAAWRDLVEEARGNSIFATNCITDTGLRIINRILEGKDAASIGGDGTVRLPNPANGQDGTRPQ